MRNTALPAAALVIGVIVAGCGSSGDGDSTADKGDATTATTAAITKAELIKKADAICAKSGKESEVDYAAFVKENKIPKGKEPSPAQFAEIGEEILIPVLQQSVDEIRALGAPAGDEAEVTAYLAGVEEAIEKVEKDPKTAKSPSTLLANSDKVARKYGFKVCDGE